MRTALISMACIAGLLAGCVGPNTAGEKYSRRDTLRTMQVRYGEVLMVVPVIIDGQATRIGLVGGGGVGYAIGREIDNGGSHVGRAVGGVVGAVAGQAIEKKITEQDGLEITIEMDNGNVIAIVQAATVEFFEGERVRVLTGRSDHARVLKFR